VLASAASYEAADSDVRGDASMMLMRTLLMDCNVWNGALNKRGEHLRRDVRDKLKAMGFRYVLSPQALIPFCSCAAPRRSSDRVRSHLVAVFEDSLQASVQFCRAV
jgi:hypothetical protein